MVRRLIFRWWIEGIWARLVGVAVFVLLLEISPVPLSLHRALERGQSAFQSGDYPGAADSFRRAYKYEPWEPIYLSKAAEAELHAGGYDAAEYDLTRLLEMRPLEAREWMILGSVYAGQGRVADAVFAWERARDLGAVDAESMAQLAESYLERRRWEEARLVLEGLAEYASDDAELHYRLGLLQALDHPEQASVSLGRAAALSDSYAQRLVPLRNSLLSRSVDPPDLAYALLGTNYLVLGELPLAETALARAVAYNPAYGEALGYLAYVRARLNEPALGAAQQALALSPDSPLVNYLVGMTWKEYNRYIEARRAFERAYDLDTTNPAFAVEIASTHRAESAFEWAEIWMNEAVHLAPDDIRFKLLLVQFYVDEEYRVEEAGLPLAQELVREAPDNAQAHEALGWAYFLTGETDLARSELEEALALDPLLGRAHFHLGQVLEDRGELVEAIRHYRLASRLDPYGPFGLLAERSLEQLEGR